MTEWMESAGDDVVIDAIEQRMSHGETVSLQQQLLVLRRRESRLSLEHRRLAEATQITATRSQLSDFARLSTRLTSTRNKIARINEEIQDSGDRGTGVMGRESIHATHNVPR